MANLFNFLTSEINKGNTLLDRKGNTVSIEKEVTKLRKTYVKEFSAGNIPVIVSFEEWAKSHLDSNYITLEFILNQLTPPEEQPEPFEDDLANVMPVPPAEEDPEQETETM